MGVQVSPGAPTIEATMKIRDKIVKVSESFTVYRYDNGFMIEVSGRNKDDEYKTVKILTQDDKELHTIISDILSMEVDE